MTKRTNRDRPYLVLTLLTLVLGGGAVIALVYGGGALLTALPFLLAGALLITVIWFLLSAVANWRERSEQGYHDAAARHLAAQQAKDGETSGTDDPGR